jgi:photosystem II stability/assembly factor-like uncharacterized protein
VKTILKNLILIGSLFLASCSGAPNVKFVDIPKDVLIAGPAVAFEIQGQGSVKGLKFPMDRLPVPRADLNRMELYKFDGKQLDKVAFKFSGDTLQGIFSIGERYIFHYPFDASITNKYDLFCSLRAIHTPLIAMDATLISDRLCPRILCPSQPFNADILLNEFNELQQFPNEFDRGRMRNMPVEPMPGGRSYGNLCDRCLGHDWDVIVIPECRKIPKPPKQCWVANGPSPNTLGQVENIPNREVVGAVNAVTPHPTDADTLFVGAVNGGIWRTSDATAANPRWNNLTDNEESLSIGALEFDPTDATNHTLVAGTGRFSSLNSEGGERAGLLRTTDELNWVNIDGGGTLQGLNISGVAPRGATIVISVNAADAPADRGIWRSTDTGNTFIQVSGAAGSGLPAGRSNDLAGDPGDTTRLYSNAGGSGVYRSDDSGATWTRVSNAAMNGLIAGAGNVQIAVGTNNNVFVAIIRGGRLSGLFRSADNGGSWTSLDLPQTNENLATFGTNPGGQGNTHFSIAADPGDHDVVYIGGDRQPCFTESTNCRHPVLNRWPNAMNANNFSGRLFRVDADLATGSQVTTLTHNGTTSNSSPHADSRDMDMRADGVLIEGDDGGVYGRTNPLTANGDWNSLNGNLATTEFHNIAWDSVGNVVIGGAQDTGTPQQPSAGSGTWASVSTADGGDVAVDDTSTPGQSVRYSSNQFLGNFRRRAYDAAGVLQSQVFPNLAVQPAPPVGNAVNPQFYTPIELNNVDATRLIVGAGNSVYESVDQGNTVSEIGRGIVANNRLGNDAIAYGATGNADMLYVGSGNRVFIRNAAAPAALAASAAYPGAAAVVDIAIDPADPDTAFVADDANVFQTTDGGATWTDVTGNLGALDVGTIRALALGDQLIVVGTDRGAFSAPGPDFDAWAVHSCGLPNVPVFDLDYDAVDRVFVAGTLGRGAWVLR